MSKKTLKIPKIIVITSNQQGKIHSKRKYGPFSMRMRNSSYSELWTLKDSTGRDIGGFHIRKNHDVHCVASAHLNSDFHSLGLGKICYQYLVDQYSILESDPEGCTSLMARRVWKSLSAKNIRNNRYRLVSKVNPPKQEEKKVKWMTYILSMMNSLKLVRLIPNKSMSKIG